MGQVWDVECEGRSRKNFTLQIQGRGLFLQLWGWGVPKIIKSRDRRLENRMRISSSSRRSNLY